MAESHLKVNHVLRLTTILSFFSNCLILSNYFKDTIQVFRLVRLLNFNFLYNVILLEIVWI